MAVQGKVAHQLALERRMMQEIFIKSLNLKQVRNLKNFFIQLGDVDKKHLIITGKNGSGKTSLLREMKMYLNNVVNGNIALIPQQQSNMHVFESAIANLRQQPNPSQEQIDNHERQLKKVQRWFDNFGGVEVVFNGSTQKIPDLFKEGEFILAFFDAKRSNMSFNEPKGINKISFQKTYNFEDRAGPEFIQYIVNLKADKSFANDDNDQDTVNKIDEWFTLFEKNLFSLFDSKKMELRFDRKKYNFNIIEPEKEPYSLNQLSDGYSAILSVVTELIMRMEEKHTRSYDIKGVVLIDEIETHLHIDLQKRILPFLTAFFPKIQFIVTTHSPFILSSIENAVICDLEKKVVTSDLSGYSYDTLVESYFDSDKYSEILKDKIDEYEALQGKDVLSDEEAVRISELKSYLYEIPKFVADELAVRLQQIRIRDLDRKKKAPKND